jgi:hypothetical protein
VSHSGAPWGVVSDRVVCGVWCSVYLKFYFFLRHNLNTRHNVTVLKHFVQFFFGIFFL